MPASGEFAALGSITEEHFDKLFNTNVKGALFTVQKALPLLNDGGSIVLTGSVGSAKGTPAFWVYGATKAAIRNFVRAWTVGVEGPCHSLERPQPGSDRNTARRPSASRGYCEDCIHHPDGTHGLSRRDCQGRAIPCLE